MWTKGKEEQTMKGKSRKGAEECDRVWLAAKSIRGKGD